MTIVNSQKIYPGTIKLTQRAVGSTVNYKEILTGAVRELGKVDPTRMSHIQGVATCLDAIARSDISFLYDRLDPKVKSREMGKLDLSEDEYRQYHEQGITPIFASYDKLEQPQRELLELAVWSHDLGIPLGFEWDHPLHGEKLIRQIIKEPELKENLASLVLHHGQISNLPSSNFVRDIHSLSRELYPVFFLLEFCDASGRVGQDGKYINPIGIKGLNFYNQMSHFS
ncbi:MAG: hypothetical protein V1843_00395, partial [bacterium]